VQDGARYPERWRELLVQNQSMATLEKASPGWDVSSECVGGERCETEKQLPHLPCWRGGPVGTQ
jgi:hypothetical protein